MPLSTVYCLLVYCLSFVQAARKPNFVLDDHSSRRRITTPLEQPTRKFRLISLKGNLSPSGRAGPARTGRLETGGRIPCLFGLAPCGVYHAFLLTPEPVRSYRTISPLPSGGLRSRRAVCFLLHWPSGCLEASVPDVIRHTALRSSDFPPPSNTPCGVRTAAIARPPAPPSVPETARPGTTRARPAYPCVGKDCGPGPGPGWYSSV